MNPAGDRVNAPDAGAASVQRLLPSEEAVELLGLVRDIADGELAPRVDDFEARGEFPREIFRLLGRAGLLGPSCASSGPWPTG